MNQEEPIRNTNLIIGDQIVKIASPPEDKNRIVIAGQYVFQGSVPEDSLSVSLNCSTICDGTDQPFKRTFKIKENVLLLSPQENFAWVKPVEIILTNISRFTTYRSHADVQNTFLIVEIAKIQFKLVVGRSLILPLLDDKQDFVITVHNPLEIEQNLQVIGIGT